MHFGINIFTQVNIKLAQIGHKIRYKKVKVKKGLTKVWQKVDTLRKEWQGVALNVL